MPNLALLTRPKCFSEIIGQGSTINQIVNHLNSLLKEPKNHAQPLILSGPRGTGKTSAGRLIAQYLNCTAEIKDTNKPCTCDNCVSLRNDPDSTFDYHELDAASHNGVGDIEKIIERTFFAPISNFKIILLDEAHMLTRHAFNALLKQLEEPPKQILYILATTEEHKILETVRSRCKIRRFNLLSDDEIMHHLDGIIMNPELISNPQGITGELTDYIVSLAKGSMRDAIKTLDEILDLDDRSLLNVQKVTGSGDIKKLGTLLCHLFDKNLASVLLDLHALEKTGVDPKKLMQQLQLLLADVLNVKSETEITKLLPPDYYKEKFGVSVNITDVCNVLGSLITTEGITRGNVTFNVLTYALVECYRILTTDTIQPTSNLTAPDSVLTTTTTKNTLSMPAYSPNQSANTADKLKQILGNKQQNTEPIINTPISSQVEAIFKDEIKHKADVNTEKNEEDYF